MNYVISGEMQYVGFSILGQEGLRCRSAFVRSDLRQSNVFQIIVFLLGCYLLTMGAVMTKLLLGYVATSDIFAFVDAPVSINSSMAHSDQSTHHINYISDLISRHRIPRVQAQSIAQSIVLESRAARIDPLLVAAIVKFESTFKAHAVSNKGAAGLMQLMPSTGKFISSKYAMGPFSSGRLHDPRYNLRLGVAYFNRLLKSFKSVEYALIAYNWGPSNLSKALRSRSKIPLESVKYAKKIIQSQRNWHATFSSTAI